MTEAGWFECRDPTAMLDYVQGKWSSRKYRLVATACCRRLWHLMGERNASAIIGTAEEFADGEVKEWKIERIRSELAPQIRHWGAWDAGQALVDLLDPHAGVAARSSLEKIVSFRFVFASAPQVSAERDKETGLLIHLLRDIVGNPFRPVVFAPEWRTDTAVTLAQQMYESREFGAMPILADALQDAGCDNPDILAHCRDPHAAHVRGCWVVDLVLGKA